MSFHRHVKPGAHRVPEELFAFRDQYVAVAGQPVSVSVEHEMDVRKNDHVWIVVDAGRFGRLEIALSTQSRQSRAAGFDPRLRVGVHTESWAELPPAGVQLTTGLDYGQLEAEQPVEFMIYEREALETLLIQKAERALFVEAWGEFYIRAHIGVHQIHSRRASLAVARDLTGRDGALKFYFEKPNQTELLLFKFAGQP